MANLFGWIGQKPELPIFQRGQGGSSTAVPASYVTGNGVVPPADPRPWVNSCAPAYYGETQLLYSDYEFDGQNRLPGSISDPYQPIGNNAVPNTTPDLEEQSQIYFVDTGL